MNPKLLIVGIGNRMRGDDAAGILLADALADRLGGAARVESNPYMLWNLLQTGTKQPFLALVDAAQANPGFQVGQWRRFNFPEEVDQISEAVLRNTHSVDVVSMLQLGQTLSILPPHVRIYAVAGSDFQMTDRVSLPLAKHLANIESEIEKDLVSWLEVGSCTSFPSLDPSVASR